MQIKAIATGIISAVCAWWLFIVVMRGIVKLNDYLAMRNAKRYCKDNNLEYIKVELYPNHYGLFFKFESKQYYAPFDFEKNRTITWKKGTPFERIEKRKKKKVTHPLPIK